MALSRTTHLKRSRRQNKSNFIITLHFNTEITKDYYAIQQHSSHKVPHQIESEGEQVADFFTLKSSREFMTMSHILKQ